ncbi:glycerate kinase [Escherichia coli]
MQKKCCQAIKAGSTLFPDANYICLPIADGGEGTVDDGRRDGRQHRDA